MPNADAIRWFKNQFQDEIEAAVQETPFSVDMLTAIACQETGYVWNVLRKHLDRDRVLALCVGDTLDADKGRKAFPKTKAELLAKENGAAMFEIARQALVELARYVPAYEGAASKPNKFCHGFGVFQYDLQFFTSDPEYFLERRYAEFGASLAKALEELRSKVKKLGWTGRATLTDEEMAAVAIAYNTGRFTPSKGLKQGYFDGTKYYGEAVFDFIRLSRTIVVGGAAAPSTPQAGTALVPPPTAVTASGAVYEVNVEETVLNVRSAPVIPSGNPRSNVVASLPDGQLVRAVTDEKKHGFLEVETSLNGALIRGYVAVKYLRLRPGVDAVPVAAPEPEPPSSGITAVYMPRKQGSVTKRTAPAGAHSLNEAGQPTRSGDTAEERRAALAVIIDWLAVEKPAHERYQPRQGRTFCNIYVHDYCHLAGCYLPRVWWSSAAIEALAQGKSVEPLYGSTIDEQRANDLFRWLRDFGLRFGWRQTGTLGKLQLEVDQGAIGLVVARRKNDGLSGHVVAVVPETENHRARRNADGEVIAALQSQAGASNFRYGTGKLDWWKSEQFAEFAFWLHA